MAHAFSVQRRHSWRRLFVEFLKRRDSAPSSPFFAAVDEFVLQHPELLRRLAQ